MTDKYIKCIGNKYGRLKVLDAKKVEGKEIRWGFTCVCDCGNTITVIANNVTRGMTLSCGCLRKEMTSKANRIHGLSNTKLHKVWRDMVNRCYKDTDYHYKWYGSRGIKICADWYGEKGISFKNFYDWSVNNGYKDGLTIDRIDVNGNYSPDNCRWITIMDQCQNRTTNRFYEYMGKKYTKRQLCNLFGCTYSALAHRLDRNNHDLTLVISKYNMKEGDAK